MFGHDVASQVSEVGDDAVDADSDQRLDRGLVADGPGDDLHPGPVSRVHELAGGERPGSLMVPPCGSPWTGDTAAAPNEATAATYLCWSDPRSRRCRCRQARARLPAGRLGGTAGRWSARRRGRPRRRLHDGSPGCAWPTISTQSQRVAAALPNRDSSMNDRRRHARCESPDRHSLSCGEQVSRPPAERTMATGGCSGPRGRRRAPVSTCRRA